jgi:hypothetical protein
MFNNAATTLPLPHQYNISQQTENQGSEGVMEHGDSCRLQKNNKRNTAKKSVNYEYFSREKSLQNEK